MCTALHDPSGDGWFGRTLDLEHTYAEQVVVTPRQYPLPRRMGHTHHAHLAFVGMATVVEGYPLYYDGVNEAGLAVAGLRLAKSTLYPPPREEGDNLAVFELIPHLLGTCRTLEDVRTAMEKVHLCDLPFSSRYPTAPLHWLVADTVRCAVIESTANGVRIHDNPVGVLANEPPFPHQLTHLANFAHLTNEEPTEGSYAACALPLSRGTGAVGLPGDFTSPSRFVRAAFVLAHSDPDSQNPVGQFFHLLDTVAVPRGSIRLTDRQAVITHYAAAMNQRRGVYYYRTYENCRLCAVALHRENLEDTTLRCYPLRREQDVYCHNKKTAE